MAANLTAKHANFISRSVALSQQINQMYTAWAGLREEYDSQAYGTGGTAIPDEDFTGPNGHITAADLTAFYLSQSNLVTWWGSGNGTNVTKLIP